MARPGGREKEGIPGWGTACAKAERPGTESLIRLRVELVSGHMFQPLAGGCVPAAPSALGRMRPWNAATAQSHRENTLDRGSWSSVCRLSECADPSLPSGTQGGPWGITVRHTVGAHYGSHAITMCSPNTMRTPIDFQAGKQDFFHYSKPLTLSSSCVPASVLSPPCLLFLSIFMCVCIFYLKILNLF